MRNLGYTCVYIILIYAYSSVSSFGQADCNALPVPDNDLCSNAINLIGLETGTTCCAAIESADVCGVAENGVWYRISQTRASILSVTNIDISGPIGVEIYDDNCGSLNLYESSDCSGFDTRTFILKACTEDYLVHITSRQAGCGSFEISVNEATDCLYAERCTDITVDQEFNPLSEDSQQCISSCLQYTCDSECTTNGVWFKLTTDALASTIQLAVKNANFNPVILVKSGTSCFNFVDFLPCQSVSSNEFITLNVTPSSTYFIQVSLGDGIPGPFDLCVNSIQDFMDCSSGTLTPMRPMFPGANPYGPYCPNETVTFCYELEFEVDIPGMGNECQWLQGLVPILGGGWNLATTNNIVNQPPAGWLWFDEGSVDYNGTSNILSLSTDQGGDLILEYGAGGIQQNDLLPGGWWYTSPGSETDCTNDGDPDNMYGLEIPCGETLNFTHCFDLTTNSVNQINGCGDNYNKDLSIKIFNFTDGETGCYDDFTCAGDTPITFAGKIDCISDLDIVADDKVICSGDFADLAVSFQEDADYAIEITVLDPGNTTGAANWIFENGKGKIPDQIINLGDQIEIVSYSATVFNNLSNCPAPVELFELSVLPEIQLDVPEDFLICEGQNTELTAPDNFASYAWYDIDNNLLSDNQTFVFPGIGDYVLEVSNGQCTQTSEIAVDMVSPISDALTQGTVEVCNFNNGSLSTILNLTANQMAGITGDWYDADDNLIPDPSAVDFEGVNAQAVLYSFIPDNGPAACVPSEFDFEIIIQECQCPSVEITQPDDICAEVQTIDLNAYKVTTEAGAWSITAGPDTGSLDLAGDDLNIYDTTIPGVYQLQFELASVGTNGNCQESSQTSVRVVAGPQFSLQTMAEACNATGAPVSTSIDLDDYVSGTATGSWSNNDGFTINSDNTVDFDGATSGDYIFSFTSNSAQLPCTDRTDQMTVRVINCSCPPLFIDNPGNLCQADYNLDLATLIVDADPGAWSLTGPVDPNAAVIINGTLVLTDSTTTGDYLLSYTLDDPNIPAHCQNTIDLPFDIMAAPYAIIPNEVITCNGGNGTEPQTLNLTPLVTGGSGGGVWSTTATEFTIVNNQINFNGVPPGFYEISYTTNDAVPPCTDATVSMTVEVEDCRCPQVNFTQFPDLCVGQDTFDLNEYIDTNADGEWYINGIVGTNAIAIINRHYLRYSTFAAPGLYTLSYRLYNFGYPADCDLEFFMDFYIHPIPKAVIKPSARVCNFDAGIGPDQINLDTMFVSGSPGDWSSPHAEINIESNNMVSFDGLDEGVYTFYYTTNDAQHPCENVEYEMNVIVDDCTCPELEVLDPGPLCQTDSRIYLWDYVVNSTGWFGTWTVTGPDGNAMNVEQLDPDEMEPGDWELVFTWAQKPHGTCPDNASNILTIFAEPAIDVVPEASVCNASGSQAPTCVDLTAMVTGDPGNWVAPANYSGDFTDLSNICFEGLPPGETYEFRYITNVAQAPCSEAEGIFIVTVEDCTCPLLNIIDPDPVCNLDGMIDLTTLETSTISPGFWEVADGPQSVSPNGTLLDMTGAQPGVYTLQYNPDQTPAAHCQAFSQVFLTVIESRSSGTGQTIDYCFDQMDELDLNQLLSNNDPGGVWREITIDNPPSFAFDEASGILTGTDLLPGKYDFQYYQDNDQPCEDNFSEVSIIINELPSVEAGESVELNCATEESVIGSAVTSVGPEYAYTWYHMGGNELTNNHLPELMVSDPGMYVLEVMNTATGCMEQDSVVVYMIEDQPEFDIDVVFDPCDFDQMGAIFAINPFGGDGDYSFSIDQGNTWTTNNAFTDLEGGEYTIMIQDGRGCENEISGIVINESEPIGLNAGEDMVLDYSDDFITIEADIQTSLSNIDSVIWTVDGQLLCEGSVVDCYAVDVNPGEINEYCVTLIDVNGCEETDCVVLEEELNIDVYIANIFSMNDITINNRIFVQSGPYIESVNEFKVYDRWGSLLFDGAPDHKPNDPDFGWDGRFNYKSVEPGVYVYFVRVTDVLGNEYKYQGDVTLIK